MHPPKIIGKLENEMERKGRTSFKSEENKQQKQIKYQRQEIKT